MFPMSSALSIAAEPDGAYAFTACFRVDARAEPGVMPRVLELFAKRGLVPQRWYSIVTADAAMTIAIEVASLGRETADYIARCMRQIVGVEAVLTAIDRP
jgi:acetolactate synthase small subunit